LESITMIPHNFTTGEGTYSTQLYPRASIT
jgi:hypothetical protein